MNPVPLHGLHPFFPPPFMCLVPTPWQEKHIVDVIDEEISNWLDFYVENSQIAKSASLKSKDVKRMIDFASLQRQTRILGKLSQVFLKLNRSERLKDFKTILNYLMNTSSEYYETKRYSDFFKSLIPILEQRLKTL